MHAAKHRGALIAATFAALLLGLSACAPQSEPESEAPTDPAPANTTSQPSESGK